VADQKEGQTSEENRCVSLHGVVASFQLGVLWRRTWSPDKARRPGLVDAKERIPIDVNFASGYGVL
jgi:hypothetical protein